MSNGLAKNDCSTKNEETFSFCPLCQAPLQCLKISAAAHIARCSVTWDDLTECPKGSSCLETSIFHYRDYAHSELAVYRSSNNFIIPSNEELYGETYKKKSPNKSVKKTRKKSAKTEKIKEKDNNKSALNDIENKLSPDTNYEKYKCNSKKSLKRNICFENVDDDEDHDRSSEDDIFVNDLRKKIKTLNNLESDKSKTKLDSKVKSLQLIVTKINTSSNDDEISVENKCEDVNDDNVNISLRSNSEEIDFGTPSSSTSSKENNLSVTRSENKNINSPKIVFVPKFERKSQIILSKCNKSSENNSNSGTSSSGHVLKINEDNGIGKLSQINSSVDCSNLNKGSVKSLETPVPSKNMVELKSYNLGNSSEKGTVGRKINVALSLKLNNVKNKEITKLKSNVDAIKNRFSNNKMKERNNAPTRRRAVTKPCPFYKRIPDTSLVVDAFRYGEIPGVNAYFLSHFHSDHYVGLRKTFNRPIFCSKITGDLIKLKIGVDEKWINILNNGERRIVHGVEVVTMDANHCPGAVMFLFQLKTGQNYLHVGDFRACEQMELYPELKQLRIHKLFLDTTYCKPGYDFPTQDVVIENVIKTVKEELKCESKTLIVCGTYLIGKEKVFASIAEACDYNIWADTQKVKILGCVNDPKVLNRLTTNAKEAQVHVLSMVNITFDRLRNHVRQFDKAFKNVIAFKPTGWSHQSGSSPGFMHRVSENITIYDVPYSEHSSFSELRRFVQFTKPDEIIPTVNLGSSASIEQMNGYFKSWLVQEKQPKQTTLRGYVQLSKNISLMDYLNH